MELSWKLIAKKVGLVCEVVTGFLRGCFYWMLVIESNSVNSEVLTENVCRTSHSYKLLQLLLFRFKYKPFLFLT